MAEAAKKYPEFQKDDYFKIDVECHLSGEANKKYFNYFPEYRKWVWGTAETARAFNAVPHHVTAPVLAVDGLSATAHIDDREPSKGEARASPDADRRVIRAAMRQRVCHAGEHR